LINIYTFDYRATNLIAYVRDLTSKNVDSIIAYSKHLINKMNGKDFEFQLAAGRVGLVAATNDAVGREQVFLFIAAIVLTGIFAAGFMESITAGSCLLSL